MNLICFGESSWTPMWKRNQTMVYLLHRHIRSKRTIFINPHVRISDLFLKPKSQFCNVDRLWAWKYIIPSGVDDGVISLADCIIGPRILFGWCNQIISKGYARLLRSFLRKKPFILLINDFAPERLYFYDILFPLAEKVIVDLSDDFLTFGSNEKTNDMIAVLIQKCIDRAELVLCVNEAVRHKYGNASEKFHVIENGLFLERVSQIIATEDPFPKYKIAAPIIGYMGWITKTRISEDIIDAIISEFKHCSIVFLGQDFDNFAQNLVKRYKNVYYIPPLPFDDMMTFIKHFDVAIIPHKVNEHTIGNNLLKTPLFLAARVPVVSTPVSGVDRYASVVDIASSKEEFCAYIKMALENRDKRKLDRGYEMACESSFERKLDDLFKIVQQWLSR